MATRNRLAVIPNVPTIHEAGLSNFEAYTWNALFAPAGTSKSIIDKLHAAATKALAAPEVPDRLTTLGYEVVGSTPGER